MKIPFTTEQFIKVFEDYNTAVFPAQIVLILLGLISFLMVLLKNKAANKVIGVFLGLLWLWNGLVYHFTFFTAINKAAYLFGSLFIFQGLFFLFESKIRHKLIFSRIQSAKNYTGYFFIIFGLFIYPAIGLFAGQTFHSVIVLGLPCPSTIVTFGFLMLTDQKLSRYLLIIPSI